jgi:hypothetical protein
MRAPAATRCCSLLTRSDLHAVSGLPEFQTKLFPFETKPGERGSPIVILHYDYGIVGCRSCQFDLMSSCFGENAFALHNAHFDVGTAVFPLDFVVSWLQSGRRVSTTLRQVFTKFSEFSFAVSFPQESSHQDRLGTTIAKSMDLRHARFGPPWEHTAFFQSRSLLGAEWKPAC